MLGFKRFLTKLALLLYFSPIADLVKTFFNPVKFKSIIFCKSNNFCSLDKFLLAKISFISFSILGISFFSTL
jgi:hypothetical protein